MYTGERHEETGSLDQCLMLDMYKGDMAASLKAVAEKEQLTDWHMALATSGTVISLCRYSDI